MTAREPIVPGTIGPWRQVPAGIPRPEYVGKKLPTPWTGSHVQTPETIAKMRVAGRLAAQATALAGEHCKPGVTTDEIDRVVHEFLVDNGAYPSTLGYKGFPKSCCTSLNEVICHGIPDSTVIDDGDIINVDVTAYLDGVHGDTDATFCVGDVSEEARLLVERTREATMRAHQVMRTGPADQRDRPGHRGVREAVRVRRRSRLRRSRHRPDVPQWALHSALRQPRHDDRDGGRA